MQILNSPSREEVDETHAKGSWLDIGAPSPRNAFRVSRFKLGCWVTLLLSSIPIHLLFNSAVFETDNRESEFHFTIASEEFISDGPYYPPGASLFLPGLVSKEVLKLAESRVNDTFHASDSFAETAPYDFGRPVYFSDYDDDNSPTVKNITDVARMVHQWTRLEGAECHKMYFESCKGLKQYTDVVLVTENQGWIRDDMWKLGPNSSAFWDRYVPSKARNNLFFDAQCSMTASVMLDGGVACLSDCDGVVSQPLVDQYNTNTDANNGNNSSRWNFVFGQRYIGDTYQSSYIKHPIDNLPSDWNVKASLKRQAFNLTVDHCLVRPIQSQCRKSCRMWRP